MTIYFYTTTKLDTDINAGEGDYKLNFVIQVLLINLVIACENVGVFALATNGLPPGMAKKVFRIGVGLSLVFKLTFIAIASALFDITWLHIRIVGGALLLYITFNMLFHSKETLNRRLQSRDKGKDSFFEAIISISVAVLSMSLDDAIAISSIISIDGNGLDLKRMFAALAGLFFGAFILLLFSDTMTKMIERFPILNNLCAGYLTYMAIRMIFEDDTIKLFFDRVNFTFTVPGAVLCGVLMAFYGLFANGILPGGDAKMRNINLPIYCIIVVYALATIGAISYLDTAPLIEGHKLTVLSVYGFIPNGSNAVYTIAPSAELITVCAAILSGATAGNSGKKSYLSMFFSNVKGMLTYVLLGIFVNTVGLSFLFGFGKTSLPDYLIIFAAQTLLLLSYTAAFTMISTFIRGKSMIIVFGLLFILMELIEAAVFIHSDRFPAVAYFFPSYHLAAISGHVASPYSIPMAMPISILYIILFTFIGYCHHQPYYAAFKPIRK